MVDSFELAICNTELSMASKACSGSTSQLTKVVLRQTWAVICALFLPPPNSDVPNDASPLWFQPARTVSPGTYKLIHPRSKRTTTSALVQNNKNLEGSKTSQSLPTENSLDLFGGPGRIVHMKPILSSLLLLPIHFSHRGVSSQLTNHTCFGTHLSSVLTLKANQIQ